jgi:nucleotide-binding universal stress UspA family protein
VQRILVAVDLSEHSAAVVETAASLALGPGAELTLVHVAEPDPDFIGYDAGPQTVRDAHAREFRAAHRRIQELADGLRERGFAAKALLVQGPTVETLVAEARRHRAEVVVMGSHNRGALAKVLLGSASEGVLRAGCCPVLVVPASRAADAG